MASPSTWHDDVPATPPSGARVGGRYAILGLVGEGAMGTVYRARDLELDEIVALKLLRPERAKDPTMLGRLRQEVRLSRRVTHPNVVRTFDLGEQEGGRFVTMEFLDGGSLGERLADEGRLPPAIARHVAVELCRGLEAAHAAGIVHRDLKPDNVMLGRPRSDGLPSRVAIGDFGVASDGGTTGVAGTFAYMAPEQARGGPIDARADLHALGAILYEMLSGRRARPDGDPASPPAPLDPVALGVPAALTDLVHRCLADDPAARPASATELRVALDAIALGPASGITICARPSARAVALAIFPFATDPQERWLGRSLAAEIVHRLTGSRGVRPRIASDDAGDPVAAGRALGVDAVLEGTLAREGGEFRLAVRLVGTADRFVLVEERFVFPEARTLEVLEIVAAEVARALVADLEPGHRIAARADLLGDWLRARDLLRNGWALGDLGAARAIVDRLLAVAPDDPAIVATHAEIRAREAFFEPDPATEAQLLAEARHCADRAARLAPAAGEPHLARAWIALYSTDYVAAGAALREAAAAAPSDARLQALIGDLLLEAGALDRAEKHLNAALAIDPTYGETYGALARLYAYRGRWDRVAELSWSPAPDRFRFEILAIRYRFRMWSPEAPPPPPLPRDPIGTPWRGRMLQAIRERLDGIGPDPELLAGMEALPATNARLRAARCQLQGELVAWLGDDDAAWRLLHGSVDAGLLDVTWLDHCPVIDRLRARPGFDLLRARVAKRAEALVAALTP